MVFFFHIQTLKILKNFFHDKMLIFWTLALRIMSLSKRKYRNLPNTDAGRDSKGRSDRLIVVPQDNIEPPKLWGKPLLTLKPYLGVFWDPGQLDRLIFLLSAGVICWLRFLGFKLEKYFGVFKDPKIRVTLVFLRYGSKVKGGAYNRQNTVLDLLTWLPPLLGLINTRRGFM